MNTNLIIFAGFVGADPVMGKASIPVAKFSIASTFKSKDKEETTWLKVACFQKTAEFAQKYVKKGARVQVIGKIKNDDYESNGNKIKSANALQPFCLLIFTGIVWLIAIFSYIVWALADCRFSTFRKR